MRRFIVPLLCGGVFWMLATEAKAAEPLTLIRALELVQSRHETAQIAEAQVERAEATRRMAASALLPDITLSGTYTRQPERSVNLGQGSSFVIQESDVESSRAALSMTVFDIRNFLVLRRAGPEFAAVAARAEQMQRLLRFDTAKAFLAVLSAEQLRAAALRRVAVAEKAKADAETRLRLGKTGKNDLTRANLEFATAELTASDSAAFIRTLRLQLARYVGDAAYSELVPPAELLASEAALAPAETLIKQAQDARPDVVALASSAKAARMAAGEPLWNLLPRLELNGQYDLSTQQGITGRLSNWNMALTASWNVFNQGREYFGRQEKQAAAREAELTHERALADVESEVYQALAQLDRIKAALSRAQARSDLAQQNAEEVAVRYREGVANAFELTFAGAEQFNAQAELARAQFDLGTAVLNVRQATGADVEM